MLLRLAVAVFTCLAFLLPAPADAGSLSGRILYVGAVPQPESFEVTDHPEHCGARITDTSLSTQNGGLADAVIWLSGLPAEDAAALPDASVEATACRFEPRVQVARTGQRLVIANGDPMPHEVRAEIDGNTLFTLALPLQGQRVPKRLKDPGLVELRSGTGYDWMRAWVFVGTHGFHAVSDAQGRYQISNPPPGTYTVKAWHERLGELSASVTLTGGEANLNLTFTGR